MSRTALTIGRLPHFGILKCYSDAPRIKSQNKRKENKSARPIHQKRRLHCSPPRSQPALAFDLSRTDACAERGCATPKSVNPSYIYEPMQTKGTRSNCFFVTNRPAHTCPSAAPILGRFSCFGRFESDAFPPPAFLLLTVFSTPPLWRPDPQSLAFVLL